MFKNLKKTAPLLFFTLSCGFLTFLFGIVVGYQNVFPTIPLINSYRTLINLTGLDTADHFLYPVRHAQSGVTSDPAYQMEGVTLLASYWDGLPGIRVIDSTGEVLHTWRINPAEIWPESPFDDHAKGHKNTSTNNIHGVHLFPNGDILFNIEYMGLVRMNSQGNVLWRLLRRTHHSIAPTRDGAFWVSAMRWIEQGNERVSMFPGLVPPFVEDTVIKVSAEGEILQEWSVLQAIYESNHQRLIWKSNQGQFTSFDINFDSLHLNDVEALPADLDAQYPSLNSGDLAISMRHISAIAILDAQTGKLKWIDPETHIHQHDPDYIGDGWLRVFDNNDDGTHLGNWLGGSRIIDVRPETGETRVVYPLDGQTQFHSWACGKSQTLDNGNILITESRAGRVLEVNTRGHILWQWVQQPWPGDPTRVAQVLEGTRYNITPQEVKMWAKPKQ
jgi:hypothetical protein